MKLSIEGHTDGDGTAEGNQKLSEERAQAVQTALVGRGIVAARLRSKGHGMSMPVVDNTTEEGKAKNRRVELVKM
jgi:outer membrane protein OmpA-like peptidoglycan-associated protein